VAAGLDRHGAGDAGCCWSARRPAPKGAVVLPGLDVTSPTRPGRKVDVQHPQGALRACCDAAGSPRGGRDLAGLAAETPRALARRGRQRGAAARRGDRRLAAASSTTLRGRTPTPSPRA
jgi:inactivated superfamily I helicase